MRPGQCAVLPEQETWPRPFTVLVAGARELTWDKPSDVADMVKFFVWLHANYPDAVVMHGGCPTGGDAIADAIWFGCYGGTTMVYPPRWPDCGEECDRRPANHRKKRSKGDKVHPTQDEILLRWVAGAVDRKMYGPGGRLVQLPPLEPAPDTYCPGAGPRRNRWMVVLQPDRCIAFPKPFSAGTRDCATLAKKARIPTAVVDVPA